ncbi:glycosyltransferase [Brevibacillus dissolubilis]|uniref:glycosyltransferase n=1 Tax=Brevibacillus dissolubilis TaxID=1844116 RepID=UPI0011172704|nr:glycosyltransferase [Brevibacillus dissolubilis]
MRILIVTQNYLMGGLETQIQTYCEKLKKQGHELYLATGSNARTEGLQGTVTGYLFLDGWTDRRGSQFLALSEQLKQYIQENEIEIVHLHPFESMLVGALAARMANVPYVVTIHGPVNLSNLYGPIYRLFLKSCLFATAAKVYTVSPEVSELVKPMDTRHVAKVLANPIDTDKFASVHVDLTSGRWAAISRLDQDKVQGLLRSFEMMQTMRKLGHPVQIDVFGHGNAYEEVTAWIEENQADWVTMRGESHSLHEDLREGYSGVMGMGRVVLEAASLNLPVLLVGYDGIKGLITRDNVQNAFQSNFSGRNLPLCTEGSLSDALHALQSGAAIGSLRDWVIENASIGSIISTYTQDLAAALHQPVVSDWDARLKRLLIDHPEHDVLDPNRIETWFEYMEDGSNELTLLLSQLRKEREQHNALLVRVAQLEQNLHDFQNYQQTQENTYKETLHLLRTEADQREQEKTGYYQDLQERTNQLLILQQELHLQQTQNTRLEEHLHQLESVTIAELQTHLFDTKAELEKTQHELSQAHHELHQTNHKLTETHDQLANCMARLSENDTQTTDTNQHLQLVLDRNQHLEQLQIQYVEALNWNKNALDGIYASTPYKIGRIISTMANPVSFTKKVAKKVLRVGFNSFRDKVSPETKQKLKPLLSNVYYKVFPEKKMATPPVYRPQPVEAEIAVAAYAAPAVQQPAGSVVTTQVPAAYFQNPAHEKVSMILPVYNHADMLDKSIQSVLAQTYPNLELIVLNDGSTDGIEPILAKYFNHPKVKVLTQRNQKLPRALTNAFEHATGDLYTWTSADNICKPHMVEKLVEFMRRNPDVDLTYANYELIDENDQPLIGTEHRYHNQVPKGSNFMSLPTEVGTVGLIEDNFIGASFMYRADAAKAIGEYDPCLVGTEDYDYWLRINELFTVKRYDSEESLYYYRVHSNSLSEKFGKSHIRDNVPKLLQYNRERKAYYDLPFDVFVIAGDSLNERLYDVLRGFLANRVRVHLIAQPGLLNEVTLPVQKLDSLTDDLLKNRYATKAILIVDESFDGDEQGYQLLKAAYGDNLYTFSLRQDWSYADWYLASDSADLDEFITNKLFVLGTSLEERDLLRKARDNKYFLWDYNGTGQKTIGYFGPLRKDLIDVELIKTIAEHRPHYDIVLIGLEGESDWDFKAELGHLPNIFFLGNKPADLQYYYLSGFDMYLLPVNIEDRASQERGLKALLHAGKPLVSSLPVSPVGLPYTITAHNSTRLLSDLDQLLHTPVDTTLLDKYLGLYLPKRKAYWLESLANNHLFYEQTRGIEKKELGVIEEPAVPFAPEKVNLLIEAQGLDKGGLEEVIFNTLKTIDLNFFNPVIVCIHHGGYVAERCEQLGIPVIVLGDNKEEEYVQVLKQHNIHMVHQHYSTYGAPLAYAHHIPVVHFIHNSYVWFTEQNVAEMLAQDPYISCYIAVSAEVKEYSTRRIKLPAHKIEVIPNGINVDWLQEKFSLPQKIYRSEYGLSDQDFVLLNLASIDGRKAQLLTIHVMKEIVKTYPDIKVLMCGNPLDESFYQKCLSYIRDYRLEKNIIFTGFVKDNQDLFKIADVFLMPSIIEGWSISKTEAMYAGKPLLLTDVGGARHVIENEDIGLLIPNAYGDVAGLNDQTLYTYTLDGHTRNFDDLKQAIIRMYQEREIWKEKGKQGTEKVLNLYNLTNIVKRYETLTKQVMFKERDRKYITL